MKKVFDSKFLTIESEPWMQSFCFQVEIAVRKPANANFDLIETRINNYSKARAKTI